MGKQLSYHMDYSCFLQVAQVALDCGCLILRKEHTPEMQIPSSDLSVVTPDCSSYWFYLPDLSDLEFIQDNFGKYYPNYSFNSLGMAMIEAGYSRFPAEQARIYVMSGYYDHNGIWIARPEQLTKLYNTLARKIRKTAEKTI